MYADDYFEGGVKEYGDYDRERDTLRERGRTYGRLLAKYIDCGRILDVGAASGHILDGFVDEGWVGMGIEPNRSMASRAILRGLSFEASTLESFSIDREPFDAISMVQVLPHLHEIRAALERALALTRMGGLWLIETWDCASVTASVFGSRWHEYNPPSVLHWFTKPRLNAVMERLGFRLLAAGRPHKSLSGAHAKALLSNGSRITRSVAQLIPDGLSVPYPGDDIFWMVFERVQRDMCVSEAWRFAAG